MGFGNVFSDLGGLNEAEMIKAVAERQQSEFSRLGIEFFSLWGRPLQLGGLSKLVLLKWINIRG